MAPKARFETHSNRNAMDFSQALSTFSDFLRSADNPDTSWTLDAVTAALVWANHIEKLVAKSRRRILKGKHTPRSTGGRALEFSARHYEDACDCLIKKVLLRSCGSAGLLDVLCVCLTVIELQTTQKQATESDDNQETFDDFRKLVARISVHKRENRNRVDGKFVENLDELCSCGVGSFSSGLDFVYKSLHNHVCSILGKFAMQDVFAPFSVSENKVDGGFQFYLQGLVSETFEYFTSRATSKKLLCAIFLFDDEGWQEYVNAFLDELIRGGGKCDVMCEQNLEANVGVEFQYRSLLGQGSSSHSINHDKSNKKIMGTNERGTCKRVGLGLDIEQLNQCFDKDSFNRKKKKKKLASLSNCKGHDEDWSDAKLVLEMCFLYGLLPFYECILFMTSRGNLVNGNVRKEALGKCEEVSEFGWRVLENCPVLCGGLSPCLMAFTCHFHRSIMERFRVLFDDYEDAELAKMRIDRIHQHLEAIRYLTQ